MVGGAGPTEKGLLKETAVVMIIGTERPSPTNWGLPAEVHGPDYQGDGMSVYEGFWQRLGRSQDELGVGAHYGFANGDGEGARGICDTALQMASDDIFLVELYKRLRKTKENAV